ncbi:hypothetical protein KRR38_28000 [Novosphingobium sp. G106]|uniref:hypothetical protein n=1 Tax=Novosphingobium sp. G106 TaxID=2849500 RepID=UPI001C2D39FD|nr:hypothetical protein [Novosphingobium sp. G106]MBV1691424.1 hypothetical protein [Novosphingobium sp. G106]
MEAHFLEYKRTKDGAHFSIDINLSNLGKTPALDVAISHKIYPQISIVNNHGDTPQLAKFPDYPMAPLMPNGTTKQRFGLRITNEQIEDAIEIAAKERCAVMVVIDLIAYYRTVFDEIGTRERTTSIRYTIHPDISPELENAWRTIGLRWLGEQGRSGTGLSFSHDKSAPAHLS